MDFQRQEWDWRRFFLGCAVSFLTPRTLTLRFILSAMIYWGFVPLKEIASLAVVCWNDRRKISFF